MPQDWVYRDGPDSRPWPPQAAPQQQQPAYDQQTHLEQIRRRTQAYGQQPAAPPAFTPRAPQPHQDAYRAPQPQQPGYAPPPGYMPPAQQQWAQYQPPQTPKNRTPRRGKHTGRKILAGAGGLIAAIIVISVAANSGHGTTSALSAGTATQTQTAAPAVKGATQTPVSDPANTAPAGTTSEMQALSATGRASPGKN